MNVSDVRSQPHSAAEEPLATGSKREPFAIYMALSAAVHGAVILGVLGGAWLWGTPTYYKPPPYTVSLVDAPLTLRQPTHAGGGEKPTEKPAAAGDQQSAAPAESASKPAPVEQPPAPGKVIPTAPIPKATPPATKATTEPQEKKPEPTEPKKPALEEPKKPVVSPPPPQPAAPTQAQPPATATEARQAVDKLRERQAQAQPPASATEARQAVDKLRERQAQEAKAQAEAAQVQQRAAEERLAALRTRYGSGGTGGGGTGRGGTGGGAAGSPADLRGIRMQAYQEWVYELIRAAWILPMPQEEARKLQATALLIVSRDGHVTRFQLLKTSGNPMFDESLLRAIKQADPLPPLPEDYQGESLEVELRFRTRES
jgi:TonB family protein